MKNNVLLGMAVTLSLCSFSSGAIASTQPGPSSSESLEIQQSGTPPAAQPSEQFSEQSTAESMAIIVTFPSQVNFNISQKQQPVTLLLAQPIVGNTGEIVAPVNSPVQAKLVATEEGATVQVEGIVIMGQLLPIRAISSELPGTELTVSTDSQNAGKSARFWGKTGMAIGCMFGGCSIDSQRTGGSAGAALGAFAGRQRGSDTEKVVQIPQGSVYILPVQAQ
ncbi:MAG: hypothetical protein AAF171_10335 [Cyanobacteria bacterium P01_A01_bin.116]